MIHQYAHTDTGASVKFHTDTRGRQNILARNQIVFVADLAPEINVAKLVVFSMVVVRILIGWLLNIS